MSSIIIIPMRKQFSQRKNNFLNVILEFKERHVGILIPMGLEQNPGC